MREIAYPVPFIIDRRNDSLIRVINVSSEPVHHLRFSLAGPGAFVTQHIGGLTPWQAATLVMSTDDLAEESLLVLRWFRPSGEEYLWQISF